MKFKAGDYVKRIAQSHQGMTIGDIDKISMVVGTEFSLTKYGGYHSSYNFIKVFPDLKSIVEESK